MSKAIKINYYDTFRCIADQCPLSCCQEWRIGIDKTTVKKWENLKLYAKEDGANEAEILLSNQMIKDGEDHIIALKEDKKCPFLNHKKLCRVVLEFGEDLLSETCTTFPRQINTFEDRIEYSLDTGCPAVVDLMRENINNVMLQDEEYKNSSLLYKIRHMLLTVIQDESYTLTERIMMAFYILLELYDEDKLTEEKIEYYKNSRQLQALVQVIRKMKFNLLDSFWERNELFLDMVHNYRKQKLYVAYLEEIAMKAENLKKIYTQKELKEKIYSFETAFKEYQGLIKNYLVAEIIANCLMCDMELEDVIIGYQWITLAYATLKQAIFLKWLVEGEQNISYEIVRGYISVISRVTGYEQNDIKEYLENSFEELIWEWGYLALVVGNQNM